VARSREGGAWYAMLDWGEMRHTAENVSEKRESLKSKIESFLNICLEVTNRVSRPYPSKNL
jgi:hypothetical protein